MTVVVADHLSICTRNDKAFHNKVYPLMKMTFFNQSRCFSVAMLLGVQYVKARSSSAIWRNLHIAGIRQQGK